MFRLEPKDIAQLVLQQRALLEAMYEGVFAVNGEKQLILINRAAREMLDIRQNEKELIDNIHLIGLYAQNDKITDLIFNT